MARIRIREMDIFGGKTVYPYVLDHKPGFLLTWVFYRLFQRVRIDENMKETLKQMHRDGTVVYAIKYRGKLDYLLYHYNFRRRRLPYPKIAFDLNMSMLLPFTHFVKIILSRLSYNLKGRRVPSPYRSGFYKQALQAGTPFLVFLVDPKGFVRHFIHAQKDHFQFLLETQKELDRPIYIVPQLVLFTKTPEREQANLTGILFGYKDNPGMIRKIALFFRHNRKAIIDFGRPLDLKSYMAQQSPDRPIQEMASEIRNMLIESIDSQKRIILGPIMKSRQQLKETVLMDDRVRRKVETTAKGKRKALKQVRKKAGEYFDEIAADFNMTYIQIFRMALKWFWKRHFEGIDVDAAGVAKVREWARKGPLIYVPSHKSHIDYLILNYVLNDFNMHTPRIAAGKNLAFWPMGHIFRKCGAFFIRRSFKNAKLYLEVFNRYIKALLEEGHPIEFFIEGGRSRNGKLVSPKTGFLSILLQAHAEGYCNDLIFVPASIAYDRIIEEKSYIRELGGRPKEKESVGQMIKARRFLKRKYGKIYIRFGHPFSLNDYLAEQGANSHEVHRDLALWLVRSINDVMPVTPLSLVATAILANHRKGFQSSELAETVSILLEFLKKSKAPFTDTLAEPSRAVQETLPILMGWKIIESLEDQDGIDEPFYYVEDEKKLELEYYKNSIIHFFIPHAFVAVSLLTGTEEIKDPDAIIEDYAFLRRLFRNEFVFETREDYREEVLGLISDFLDPPFLSGSSEEGGYKITKLGFDKLTIFASLAKTFLESYWIAAKTMQEKYGSRRGEVLKAMNATAKRYHKLKIIDHIGALSPLNFENAMPVINQDVLKSKENPDEDPAAALDRLSRFVHRLYGLSHYGR